MITDPKVLIRKHIRRGNFAATRPRPAFTPWPIWTRDIATGSVLMAMVATPMRLVEIWVADS